MRSNIETIRFMGRVCLVLAVLTYIITLNIDIGFFQPNWSWISNNFALTVCGGALASLLVVLLCEVQKYWDNKSSCENYLFAQAIYLYSALYYMVKNIDEYIMNQNQSVSDNLIDDSIQMIRSHAMAIRTVDYVTFRKSNILATAHRAFCSNTLINIDSTMRYGYYIKLAISHTQIKNLTEIHSKGIVTSADELVAKTLVAIKSQIMPMVKAVSDYLEGIDASCGGRYDWKQQKAKIEDSYISIFKAGRFEDFLKQAEE